MNTLAKGLAGLTIFSLFLLSSAAQGQETLRWKLQEGDHFKLTFSQTSSTTVPGAEGEEDTKIPNAMSFYFDWVVTAVDADGVATITQSMDRVTMSGMAPFLGEIDYDSAAEGEPEGGAAFLAQAIEPTLGMPFEIRLSPRGEILEITMSDESLAAFGGGNPEFDPNDLRSQLENAWLVLPEAAVSQGSTWEQTLNLPDAPGQLQIVSVYTYQGAQSTGGQEASVIDAQYTIELPEEDDSDDASGEEELLPMPDLSITSQEGSGKIEFDNEAGRLLSSTTDLSVGLKVEAEPQEAGGEAMSQSAELSFQIEWTLEAVEE